PKGAPIRLTADGKSSAVVEVVVPGLEAGGYNARVRVGASPPTRHDFACERAGPSWGDSRPDPQRLDRLAAVTSGQSVDEDAIESLPVPEPTEVAAERHVSPLLPAWAWSLGAATLLGAHWVARRRAGLA
ncbi:MAG TPA: hypothetical protein VF395_22465, partial [Polyangiaceae bacterium]